MTRRPETSRRDLQSVPGVGPSIARDLEDLGFAEVDDLVNRDPEEMFEALCALRGVKIDRCVLYVFRCAVYYAGRSRHDPELLKWWNWKDGGRVVARRPERRTVPEVEGMEDPFLIDTLALDLEGTLISNAHSRFPRPGLSDFLEFCRHAFDRVVVFTAVDESRFRDVARSLAKDRLAPRWFEALEYVSWQGWYKDLEFIPHADVDRSALLDDYEPYVHPAQIRNWIPIRTFKQPYRGDDSELARVRRALEPRSRKSVR